MTNKNKSIVTNLMIYVGEFIAALCCFTTLYSVSFLGITRNFIYAFNEGKASDGMLVVIFLVVSAIFCMVKLYGVGIPFAGIALIICAYDFSNIHNVTNGYGTLHLSAYLIVIGIVVALIGMVLGIVWKVGKNIGISNKATIKNTICPTCGENVDLTWKACPKCATSLESVEVSDSNAAVEQVTKKQSKVPAIVGSISAVLVLFVGLGLFFFTNMSGSKYTGKWMVSGVEMYGTRINLDELDPSIQASFENYYIEIEKDGKLIIDAGDGQVKGKWEETSNGIKVDDTLDVPYENDELVMKTNGVTIYWQKK